MNSASGSGVWSDGHFSASVVQKFGEVVVFLKIIINEISKGLIENVSSPSIAARPKRSLEIITPSFPFLNIAYSLSFSAFLINISAIDGRIFLLNIPPKSYEAMSSPRAQLTDYSWRQF